MKRLLIMITVLLSIAGCSDGTIEGNKTNYQTIEIEEVEQYIEKGYAVLDVREVEEYHSGHIPRAINLPLSGLEKGEFSSISKDGKYVVICRSGNRSVAASNILTDNGFHVINVKEGMSSWTGDIER